MGYGNSYPFALEIMEGGLYYGKRKCDNHEEKNVGSLYLSCNGSWIDTDRSLCCGK